MKTILGVLLIFCMIGAVVMIVRGVIIWARTSREELLGNGPSQSGLQQNKMMWGRIKFQAIAVVIVILLLLMAKGSAG